MALKTKLNFVSQDRSGRIVTVVDATGKETDGVTTGYGPQNGQLTSILCYYFVISRFGGGDDYVVKVDGTDPRLPSKVEIANGADVRLTTDLFVADGETDIFYDGVVDLNMYVEFLGLSGVVIEKDNGVISGADFTETLKGDAIIVDGTIYQINKHESRSDMLVILGQFENDSTSYNTLYRANTKALLMSMSEKLHDYACDQLSCSLSVFAWMNVNTAASYRRAAKGFFNDNPADYYKANKLALANFNLLKKYTEC